jgi:hypothetical protein
MKKVIDGKTYNTETAAEIGNYHNSLGSSDFRNIDESLYVTKKGTFFISGEGGPMTKYASHYGNASSSGDGMFVVSKEEALQWCESYDIDADTIAEYFDIEEG